MYAEATDYDDLFRNTPLGHTRKMEGMLVTRVPSGWLVREFNGTGHLPATFVPDLGLLSSLIVGERR